MSNLILHREHNNAIALPAPRIAGGNITVREATLKDIDFIDALQRKHARAVGWFPKGQIEGCGAGREFPGARSSGGANFRWVRGYHVGP